MLLELTFDCKNRQKRNKMPLFLPYTIELVRMVEISTNIALLPRIFSISTRKSSEQNSIFHRNLLLDHLMTHYPPLIDHLVEA